jgi:hypothetical protein
MVNEEPTMATIEDLELDEAERAYEAGRKAGGGKAALNPYGRGGRTGHFARKHLADAIQVCAEVMANERATDQARVAAADIIIRTAKG